ncbi:hypothetical protein LCGC14_2668410 [marine sediment metagenome]|uniref:Uncharacterized protein n=1 Tax=marine sediment metagenome TaxID=412755 RepID=A0A0F9BZW6_9ZZZZ
MKKLAVVLFVAWLTFAGLVLYSNGNLLVWTDPVVVCVGWPDDEVYSWWCTDYRARR